MMIFMTNLLPEAHSFWIHFTLGFYMLGIKSTEPYQKKVGGETCHTWRLRKIDFSPYNYHVGTDYASKWEAVITIAGFVVARCSSFSKDTVRLIRLSIIVIGCTVITDRSSLNKTGLSNKTKNRTPLTKNPSIYL